MAFACSLRVLLIVGSLFVAIFIVSLVLTFKVFPDVIYSEVNNAVELDEDTEQYDRFIDFPFPVEFRVYLFNVENPKEILQGGKPNLTEKGPYVYKQFRKKTIVEMNDEEDTISYTQEETFEFDSEASHPLTEDDLVTVVNAPLLSIYTLSEEFYLAGAVDNCVKSTFREGHRELFIEVPVKELVFDGFNFCKNDGNDICTLVNDIVCAISSTKRNVDILPDYSLQFSFLNYKAKAPDGKYTVNRGRHDIDKLGHIMAWNDVKYTNYWGSGTTCSKVKGFDATIFPPRMTKDSSLYIYATDVCRYVEITYQREDTYKDIDGYVFETTPATFRNATRDPRDDCFCTMLTKNERGEKSCFLDGVIDMQACFGVPLVLSFPHFLWADQKYYEGVIGINPQKEKHKTFLLLEPNTGTPLKGSKKIQLNIPLRPITGIKYMTNVRRVILPLLWVEEGVSLTDKYIDELKTSYFGKIKMIDGVKWSLVAFSALVSVILGGFIIRKRYFKST